MSTDSSSNEEEKILKLWSDINFPGSFRGVKTFQALLKSDLNIDVSEQQLYKILRKEPIYLVHLIKPYHVKRRPFVTHSYGEVVQADIGFMFPDPESKFKCFLLLIDVYSNKIFIELLENKTSSEVARGLKNIFTKFGAPIYKLETDNGKEFTGSEPKALYKKLHLVFKTKRGLHKASFAEAAIKQVKRKLFMFLRKNLTKHWSSYIDLIVDGLNSIPLKRLGYLSPNLINDVTDSVKVNEQLKLHNLPIPKQPTYVEQRQNTEDYFQSLKYQNEKVLKVGDYVYIRLKKEPLTKSFDLQVWLEIC